MPSLFEMRKDYMMLESQFRVLEERVNKLEAEIKIGMQIGTYDKLANTSLSLFLMRRDREALASALGLPQSDYDSTDNLVEAEIDRVIEANKDVLASIATIKNLQAVNEVETVYNTATVAVPAVQEVKVESVAKDTEVHTSPDIFATSADTEEVQKKRPGRKKKEKTELVQTSKVVEEVPQEPQEFANMDDALAMFDTH